MSNPEGDEDLAEGGRSDLGSDWARFSCAHVDG